MKQFAALLAFVLLNLSAYCQKPAPISEYAAIDAKALGIPENRTSTVDDIAKYITENFKGENDKVRAAFAWVASNIEYDVKSMYSLNYYENKEERIERTLLLRKSVCAGYAAVFSEICNKAGVKCYVVEGFTKQGGNVDHLGHAWNVARIDGAWYPFDPTWGAGYINNGKFVKKINNTHFKATPAEFIKTHMPFDYLWQCLEYPLSAQKFIDGNFVADKSRSRFSYPDSIAAYEAMNSIERLSAVAGRMERNGIKNDLAFERLQHIRLEIENTKRNSMIELYNGSTLDVNTAVNDFNDFVNYKNKQFTPARPDKEIQQMLDGPAQNIKDAKSKLEQIKDADENTAALIVQLNKSIAELDTRINEEQQWLQSYLKKGKAGRKSSFYKVTWFGVH